MSQPKQLTVDTRLIWRCVLYFGAEVLMTVALFVYAVPAGVFSIGFFVWIDLFAGNVARSLRGTSRATRYAPDR